MSQMSHAINAVLFISLLLIIPLFQATQAYASGSLILNGGHHENHGRYAEVVIGTDRYYYDAGVFYRGEQGHYIASQAPMGAVVYSIPSDYEGVEIEGVKYLRYRDVYYRPEGRGYKVVQIEKSRQQKNNDWGAKEKRNERQDGYYGKR